MAESRVTGYDGARYGGSYLACFVCGTSTKLEDFVVPRVQCPTCEAKRIEAIVADRCAPLVAFAERVSRQFPPNSMHHHTGEAARDALRAHRERCPVCKGTGTTIGNGEDGWPGTVSCPEHGDA